MSDVSAAGLGLKSVGKVHHNLSYDELFEHETRNKEGQLSANGTMMVDTGKFTGRSPKDKYFVQQDPSQGNIAWGNINKPVSEAIFDELHAEVIDYLSGKDVYVADGYSGANPQTTRKVRFITEIAWQSHFIKNMFIRPTAEQLESFAPDFTVYNAAGTTNINWEKHGLNSEVFVIFNIEKNIAIIGGSWYGGEMKK
ncbi:MAG: phosphoenolpyruvate carboxykinase (ATP), partial [Desulfuromonadales bacterium]|nr:phosphoenolpyruvate carboxykinase (ATP) [Desulfuromonadales bacterium]